MTTLNDLVIDNEHIQPSTLLRDWEWLLPIEDLEILLITIAGDAFLVNRNTGEIVFLDVWEGCSESFGNDHQEFKKLLSDNNFVSEYFSLPALENRSKSDLEPDQVFTFIDPMDETPENRQAGDVYEHFSSLGQLWDQAYQAYEAGELDDLPSA